MLYLYPASILGGGGAGAPPDSQSIFFWGGDPDLRPETAETVSVGFVARPDALPGLRLEANWFQIDYTDRVLPPIASVGETLTNPAYAEFRTLNPSIAEINAAFAWAGLPEGTFTGNYTGAPYDPANVFAIVRGSNTNAASDFLQGVDLSARYRLDAWGGSLSLHFSGTWLTEAHRKLSSTSPEIPTAGIAFFPPEFRGRVGANWSHGGFTLKIGRTDVCSSDLAPYDPANVFAIVRGSNTNAASDFLQGVDLSARYRLDAWGGSLSLHFSGTWLTEAHRKLSSTSPEIPTAGIAFFPPEFRGRVGANWSHGGFTL